MLRIYSLCLVSSCLLASSIRAQQEAAEALEGQGVVVPARRASVTSSVPGRITEVRVQAGQLVKKDDVLLRLEPVQQEAKLKQAEAQLRAAKARLEKSQARPPSERVKEARAAIAAAEASVRLHESEVARLRRLHLAGTITAEELARSEALVVTAQAELDKERAILELLEKGPAAEALAVFKAEVDVAEAEVAQARTALEATTIRAPMDGMVTRMWVEVGSFTNPAMYGLASAASLCELADVSTLAVEATLPEQDFGRVRPGMSCEVRLNVLPDKVFRGAVERIVPVIDPGRKNFTVRVKLGPVGEETIPLGASATVRFLMQR